MKLPSWLCSVALVVMGSLATQPLGAAEDRGYPVKPFLWKIEGKNLEKPSYLFGTIYVTIPAIEELHPLAEKAFLSADTVYTEPPWDAGSKIKMERKDGMTLSQSIGDELTEQLDTELKNLNPKLDTSVFQPLQTCAASMVTPRLKYQLKGRQSMDQVLISRVANKGKETVEIESIEDQIGAYSAFSEKENIAILRETLSHMKDDRSKGIDRGDLLIAAYAAGDEAKLNEEIESSKEFFNGSDDKELTERILKKLFTDRDLRMAVTIAKYLETEPGKVHFFAVGVDHLIGKDTIGDHLTQKGYKISRIEE